MITRRGFVLTLGAAPLASALPALAQGKTYRIGWLAYGRSMVGSRALDALRDGLSDLGYVDGRNLSIIERWSEATASSGAILSRSASNAAASVRFAGFITH